LIRYNRAVEGNASTASVRDELRHIADELPDNATWADVIEEIHLQMVIELGLQDAREGRVKPLEEIRRKYGLPE